jgi:hypothetical protein
VRRRERKENRKGYIEREKSWVQRKNERGRDLQRGGERGRERGRE